MRNYSSIKSALFFSSALSALAFSGAVSAQETAGKLDDVIVTATRSETDLQKTPIAVTALNATALEERGVTNLIDLGAIAPNVSIGSRAGLGVGGGGITIRGIGIDAIPPASPAVGIYVDDVYIPAAFGNLIGVFDVDRIEVLRGPQGTLFGRNTISGALQYVTKNAKPGEFSGFAEATIGNLDRRDESAAVNIPIGDKAAFRVSFARQEREGYLHDDLNNVDRGSQDSTQARVKFHLDATDRLTLDAKFEALDQRSNGRATIATSYSAATAWGFGAILNYGPGVFASIPPATTKSFAGFDGPDFYDTSLRLGQAVIGYDLTDNIHLKSISAYSESQGTVSVDFDNAPVTIIHINRGDQKDELFTQELQLTGDSFSDRLHWTAGVYYYDGTLNQKNAISTQVQPAGPPGGPPYVLGLELADPSGDYEVGTQSTAIYGQATFDLTDKLSVVAGLRYTTEDIDVEGGRGSVPAAGYIPYTDSVSFEDTAPLLGLNYQATEDMMFYVKGSKGFRAGGFVPLATGAAISFRPEEATTYEAGARLQFFDRRLRINPTYFHTDWKDIQFNAVEFLPPPLGLTPLIRNAGDVEMDGAEVEAQWAVTDRLSLNASLSWLDAEYTSLAAGLTNPPPPFAPSFSLNSELARAPETQYTLGGVYDMPLGDMGNLKSSLSYAWQDDQRSASSDLDFVTIEAYGLLSGRVEYVAPGGKWSFAVFGTNLTDEDYLVGGTNFPGAGALPAVTNDLGRPREYGVTLRANF